MNGSFLYKCTSRAGALLALQDDADRDFVLDNWDWVDYMYKNHASWYRFAKESLRLRVEKEKLILIRGRIRASRWLLTSFSGRDEVLQFEFAGGIPYCGGCGATYGQSNDTFHSPTSRRSSIFETDYNSNLSDTNRDDEWVDVPQDCVFISSYRAKYRIRSGRPKKITAAGKSGHAYSEDGDESSGGGSLSSTSSSSMNSSPDDIVLNPAVESVVSGRLLIHRQYSNGHNAYVDYFTGG